MTFWRIIGYSAVILGAFVIFTSETVQDLFAYVVPVRYVAEFAAGMLYTSLITTPLSLALLAALSESSNIYIIALVGGAGAVFGDFILLNFFSSAGKHIHIRKCITCKPWIPTWAVRFVGVACLILPLPDELAMAFLGIRKIRVSTFIMLVYPAKTLGILLAALGMGYLL